MTLPYRTTVLGLYNMVTLSHGSQLQFGDTFGTVHLKNRVLAIQRAIARFEDDELRFASYPLFFLPNPVPTDPPPTPIFSTSRTGTIEVGAVHVLAATASSFIRAGDGYGPHMAESRVLDIRHYNDPVANAGFTSPPVRQEYSHREPAISGHQTGQPGRSLAGVIWPSFSDN